MTESDVDTSRVTVRTYVPSYQRDEWDADADELGMSRSEFVRSMVQAGRHEFGLERGDSSAKSGPESTEKSDTDGTAGHSNGSPLEERVLRVLSGTDYLSWDELVTALTDDIERRLEDVLQELQAEDRIRYSGRNGGYTLDDE